MIIAMTKYKIVAKYLKIVNFQIKNTEIFLKQNKNVSDYKINIDIKSNQIKKNLIEVIISLSLKPSLKNNDFLDFRVSYSVVIEIKDMNIRKEEIKKIILVKIPTDSYSEIRDVFKYLFKCCGFNEINIEDSINFEKLYLENFN